MRAILILVSALTLISNLIFAQDRLNDINITYPEALFHHNGGRVIDVTQAPFNATGDGVTDDTDAIIAAYNFIADHHRKYTNWKNIDTNYIIYFPEGEYLVNKPLIYDGDRLDYPDTPDDGIFNIRIVGQNRANTSIRLADNAPGFGSGTKELLCFQKPGLGTNIPGRNELRNITINTGSGNPAAVGVYFISANTGVISDVHIVSEDGLGNAGLEFATLSVQGCFNDITVDGFKYGIYVNNPNENQPTIENITLINQNTTGIYANNGCPAIRKLKSINDVTAVTLGGGGSQTILIDSDLEGLNNPQNAIKIAHGQAQLFARNVIISGYTNSISKFDGTTISGDIEEFYSENQAVLNNNTIQKTLNLSIVDIPSYQWPEDVSEWVLVDTCPGTTDNDKFQNAINSGKSTIWLGKKHTYNLSGSIDIPSTVKYIMGCYAGMSNGFDFEINEASSDTLFMYNIFDRVSINHRQPRTLLLRHASASYQNFQNDSVMVLLESIANIGSSEHFCPANTYIYARGLNDETKTTANFKIYGGQFWMLGHKTEGMQSSFEVKNGGVCEILGGYRNETGSDEGFATVVNNNSHVTYIGFTNMCSYYDLAIVEQAGLNSDTLKNNTLPIRNTHCATNPDHFVLLYNKYSASVFNGLPEGYFTSPTANIDYYTSSIIDIEINAFDRNGSVVSVEFFIDDVSIGVDNTGSDGWSYAVSNLSSGDHILKALVTDNESNTNYSHELKVTIAPPPPSLMTGHWKLDGNAINDVTGESGTASSGITYTGGFFGQAASFDGSSQIMMNDITMSNDSGSVSFWFNTVQTDNQAMMIYTAESGTRGNGFGEEKELHINLNENNGQTVLYQYIKGSTTVSGGGTDPVNDGVWHHAVLTWQNGDKAKLYLDNQLIDSRNYAGERIFYGDLIFGAPQANQRKYKGLLDDVRVFNYLLNTDSINDIFSAALFMHLNLANGSDIPNNEPYELQVNTLSSLDSVEFYIDGNRIGSDINGMDGWSMNWTPKIPGTVIINARGFNAESLVGEVSANVNVINNLPSIDFIVPGKYGSVTPDENGVLFEVEVNDLDGTVDSVLFYINGALFEIDNSTDGFATYYQPETTGKLTYKAQAVDNNGGKTWSNEYYIYVISLFTSTNKLVINEPFVYPNPAQDIIALTNLKDQVKQIYILSPDGKIIKTIEISNNDENTFLYDISDVNQGVYFLFINTTNDQYILKLIKE